MTNPELRAYKDEIAARIHGRESIDDIDELLIQPAPFSDDTKAALWLYAWSLQPRRRQRRIALNHLVLASQGLLTD